MPRANINGAQIYYEVYGEGFPLILANSAWKGIDAWSKVIPLLSKKYQVIAYDPRWYGQSNAPPGDNSLNIWADDLNGLLEHLNIENAHLVGLCTGTNVALEFILAHPDKVSGAVLSGPMVTPWKEVESIARRWPNVLEVGPRNVKEWANFRHEKDIDRFGRPVVLPNRSGRLSEIKTPILVLTGDKDVATPVYIAKTFQSKLPNSKLVIIPKGDRHPEIKKPAYFSKVVTNFTAGVDAGKWKHFQD